MDTSYDEAVDADGRPRPQYRKVLAAIADLGVATLRSREGGIEQEQRTDNITFRVTGQTRAQLFPLDLVPRMVAADEWALLCDGLAQRARALDAFLRDIYFEQAIVGDGVIGVHALDRAPGFRSTGGSPETPCARTSAAPTWCATGRALDGARGQSAGAVGHRRTRWSTTGC